MAHSPFTILDLLEHLRGDGLFALTPAQAIQIQTLLSTRESWPELVLVHSLTALLATDTDEANAIEQRLLTILKPRTDADGSIHISDKDSGQSHDAATHAEEQPRPRRDATVWIAPATKKGAQPTASVPEATVISRLIQTRNLIQTVAGAVGGWVRRWYPGLATLAAAIAVTVWVIAIMPPVAVAPPLVHDAGPVKDAGSMSGDDVGVEFTVLQPQIAIMSPAGNYERYTLPWFYGGLFLAIIASLVGAMALWAWGGLRNRYEREKIRALAERDQLAGTDAGADTPYHIECPPPIDEHAINDAAGTLGLIGVDSGGRDLDVPATIDGALRRPGELWPQFANRQRPATILALVDMEAGNHPRAHSVDRLLQHWQSVGVALTRYEYAFRPDYVHPATGDGALMPLERLARQYPNAVVLVLSALAQPENRAGHAHWISALSAWPAAAVIELDPRPSHERPYDVARVRVALTDAGLGPFPFTEEGVMAAARHLAGRQQPPPSWPPLATIDDPAIADALRSWAACAAYVPQPSWPQLEALRLAKSLRDEIGRHLPEAAYVYRLIEWLEERPEVRTAVAGGGDGLSTSEELEDALIAEQRLRDGGSLEERARQLILKQLEAAKPQNAFAKLRREFKIACHEAVLDPTEIEKLLEKFQDSALMPELREFLHREGQLQTETQAAPKRAWGQGTRAVVSDWLESKAKLAVAALARPVWARWRSGLAVLVGGCLPVLVLFLYMDSSGADQSSLVVERDYVRPVWQVTLPDQDLAETAYRPALVNIPAGSFTMGSPESERERAKAELREAFDDESLRQQIDEIIDREGPQHEVEVSPFYICRTEITQENWEAVMGNQPSDCDDGCGANYPVQNISWLMAGEYMNRLTERENTSRAAENQLSRCYEIRGEEVRWEQSCTGYRMPTEAEWEYAARAGTVTAYSFHDDATELDAYAWHNGNAGNQVHEVGTKRANPWGLYDMHGNVWEWVWDWYGPYGAQAATNPTGPEDGSVRVLRGGSFIGVPGNLRSADRVRSRPGDQSRGDGVRCARAGARASLPP